MNRSSTEQARDDRRSHPVVTTLYLFSEFWNNRSHIFDGVTLTSETAAFQLCDITDPMLKQMIEEEEDVRDSCSVGIFWLIYPSGLTRLLQERDGWFTSRAMERIKTVLRHKFFALLEGYVATDEECLKLLEHQDGAKAVRPFARRPRPGKHNMAKGALPVEDAAVCQEPTVPALCLLAFSRHSDCARRWSGMRH